MIPQFSRVDIESSGATQRDAPGLGLGFAIEGVFAFSIGVVLFGGWF